jgi:hypothetical protein
MTQPVLVDPPRVRAREALVRYLQIPQLAAASQLDELADDDVERILTAAAERHGAVQQIKAIFAAAHDRQSAAAAIAARQTMERLRRSGLVRQVLERELGSSLDESIHLVGDLPETTLETLAQLAPIRGCAEEVRRVLGLPEAQPRMDTDHTDRQPAVAEAATEVVVEEPTTIDESNLTG